MALPDKEWTVKDLCWYVQLTGALQTPQIPVAVRRRTGSAAEQPAGESPGVPHHHTRRESWAPHELHRQRAGTTCHGSTLHVHQAITCAALQIAWDENVFLNYVITVFLLQNFYKEKKREDIYIRWVGLRGCSEPSASVLGDPPVHTWR